MPNEDNILRPITLVSYGRSGTSLVHNILAAHPDIEGCGETMPLIFGTWEGSKRVRNVIRPDQTLPEGVSHNVRSGKAVRAVFQAMFPNRDTPHWVHKPINVPFTVTQRDRQSEERFEEQAEAYWTTMRHSWPDGTASTVRRQPDEVARSAVRYWGFPTERIWRSIVNMAQILNHETSPVTLALRHSVLASEPEPEIARLLDHLGLSHDPACFAAAEKVYVPKRGEGRRPKAEMTDHVQRAFSHRDQWDQLDMSSVTDRDREILTQMWARFGEPLNF